MSDRKRDEQHQRGVGLQERDEEKVKKPRLYKVLLHNDDYTPVPWVAAVLTHIFRKSQEDAMRITMQVHEGGVGVAGVYTHEIAETKVATVHQYATKDGHPFMCSMEPDA